MSPVFTLKIVTPEKLLREQEVASVTLPLQDGEATLLADHEAYIGVARPGEARVRSANGEEETFALSGGFVEFHNNVLVVLADSAEPAAAIDIARAEEAKKRAEELMQRAPDMDEEAYQRTAALLEKELTRLKVARKHHSNRGTLPASE
jgi:F-type H+-transporting ATPase subunit epsilon